VTPAALRLSGVRVRGDEGRRPLLDGIDWTVRPGEHWAVIGLNGAGKSTLLGVAAGTVEPEEGTVEVLGERFGADGLRDPRLRIGVIEGRPRTYAAGLTAEEVVVMHRTGPAAVMGAKITAEERRKAVGLLERFECAHLRRRRYATCSQGERQRVMLARTMMRDPDLLLLDEPGSSLDLPTREAFVRALAGLAADHPQIATITVAHHLEELGSITSHALLLSDGRALAQGPAEQVLTAALLSECFAAPIALERPSGRWEARLAGAVEAP
jgi:iron complex transport system ATP-binding protein